MTTFTAKDAPKEYMEKAEKEGRVVLAVKQVELGGGKAMFAFDFNGNILMLGELVQQFPQWAMAAYIEMKKKLEKQEVH